MLLDKDKHKDKHKHKGEEEEEGRVRSPLRLGLVLTTVRVGESISKCAGLVRTP